MIRHDYNGCGTCHADPTGGGPLTAYGRAQGDVLMTMRYGASGEEPRPSAGFLWGAVEPPGWLLPGGDIRMMGMLTKPGDANLAFGFILMQADLRTAIVAGGFRAGVSAGLVSSEGSSAAVAANFISREHWLGYSLLDDQILLRVGRINVPFGIRQIDHTLYVRRSTRTDLNDTQQHGVAVAYSGDKVRAELMGIAGNYQISPDSFRQRGYSGFIEVTVAERLALGVSSLMTTVKRDQFFHVGDFRQAHGAFARYAPVRPLALLAEADLVLHKLDGGDNLTGYAAMLQADVEPLQGLHFIATGEVNRSGISGEGLSYGAWGGANWFFLPHADMRVDASLQHMAFGPTSLNVAAYMLQLHTYL